MSRNPLKPYDPIDNFLTDLGHELMANRLIKAAADRAIMQEFEAVMAELPDEPEEDDDYDED